MTLAESGQIYVTHAAAVAYARHLQHVRGTDPGAEEARRRLTELLASARRMRGDNATGPTGVEHWRRRSRTDKADISAHVAREGGLAKVVYVQVRNLGPQRSERPNHGYPER